MMVPNALNRLSNSLAAVAIANHSTSRALSEVDQNITPAKPFACKQMDPLRTLSQPNFEQQGASNRSIGEEQSTAFMVKGKLEGPRGGITGDMLKAQHGQLYALTMMETPFSNNVNIYRGGEYAEHSKGYEFADFGVATRQQLTEIAQTQSGKKLFAAMNTHMDGRPIKHQVGIQDAGIKPGIRESSEAVNNKAFIRIIQAAERFNLAAGYGCSVVVSHHVDMAQRWGDKSHSPPSLNHSLKERDLGLGLSSAIGLGHELIHAAHAMRGQQILGKTKDGVLNEELSTVVGMKGAVGRSIDLPTENDLRQDMSAEVFNDAGVIKNIEARTVYSGKKL